MNHWRCDAVYSSGDICCFKGAYYKLQYRKNNNGSSIRIDSINQCPSGNPDWELL